MIQPDLLTHLVESNDEPAWRDPQEGWLSYGELARRVAQLATIYPAGRHLVYLPFVTSTLHLLHYLLALRDGHAIMLADPAQDAQLHHEQCQRFSVSLRVLEDGAVAHLGDAPSLHPELAMLLPTSGSTGSCKWVRLSRTNLDANAAAIAEYLTLNGGERAITSLPLFYSFGMSVLNSHLLAGASLVSCTASPLERQFWDEVNLHQVTSVAGVPFTFQMLNRLRFDWARYPSLMTLTQAGGRLEPALAKQFAEQAAALGRRFFVMYGQTEAAPRIAWLAHDEVMIAPDAIGRAIPGGRLSLRHESGFPDGEGELVYEGPNVMLGYAERPEDLARGRDMDALFTGDLARCDEAGRFYLTGRLNRFLKLFGKRVSLAEVEAWLQGRGYSCAATGRDDRLLVAIEADACPSDALQLELARWLMVPPSSVRIYQHHLPRRSNMKIDYPALLTALEQL
ncbi:AMP-binding protein [Aeromonas veronii]|uniref:AMP-binding protein n=1 Tax=Aeromonas veronii TaxID=654 RepID=UPI002853134D|nr:AMP-binding protein [Aeromonas veronii]MDR5013050.1 AMP-binding protein [Aeromonas veronii]